MRPHKLLSWLILAALMIGVVPFCASQSVHSGLTATAQRRRAAAPRPLIPAGTQLRVRLNDNLSTNDSKVGDRFTATVITPARYDGATMKGRISAIKKSGRVQGRTTMTMRFDGVEMADGRKGLLRADVVRIYDSGSGKVDEEGRVESGSRGKQTLKRSGIGAAAGAVLGGIVGGGKGVAIGLIVGGAAGAGSIAIEGGKELELQQGTEMLLRVVRR